MAAFDNIESGLIDGGAAWILPPDLSGPNKLMRIFRQEDYRLINPEDVQACAFRNLINPEDLELQAAAIDAIRDMRDRIKSNDERGTA